MSTSLIPFGGTKGYHVLPEIQPHSPADLAGLHPSDCIIGADSVLHESEENCEIGYGCDHCIQTQPIEAVSETPYAQLPQKNSQVDEVPPLEPVTPTEEDVSLIEIPDFSYEEFLLEMESAMSELHRIEQESHLVALAKVEATTANFWEEEARRYEEEEARRYEEAARRDAAEFYRKLEESEFGILFPGTSLCDD